MSVRKNMLQMGIVAGATYHAVSSEMVWVLWSDCYKYISMAEGLGAGDPFGRRILIPWLAGIVMDAVGCDATLAFYCLNLMFVLLAGIVILREHGLLTALIVLSCTGAFSIYFGKLLLDAGMFLLVVLALYFAGRKNTVVLFCIVTLSTMVHPIAFVLCSIVFVFSVDGLRLLLVAFPALVFYLWFMPTSYVIFQAHGLIAVLAILKMLSIQWLGVLTLRFDKQSLMILTMFAACCVFSLFLTWPARGFVMLSPVLAPRLREMMR